MTADDEIRAAAERFGNPKPGDAYPWPCEMHEQPLQRSLDSGLLARAYLNPWRPIDTAPRDGTRVLLWWDGWDIQLGSWHPLHGWQTGPIVHCQPTHWTPLPLPPAPAA